MKIVRTKTSALRNEEWFQLFTEFKDLVVAFCPSVLDIVVLFNEFIIFYNEADDALDFIRKSLDTDLMKAADVKRDHTFRGLVDAVKSSLNHFNPNKKRAAEELDIVIKHFGNLAAKSGTEETAGIYNLTQMFSGEYAAQTALLGLEDRVEELQVENNAYEALVKARNDEVVARTKFRMKAVRKGAEGVYHKIVERLEAKTVLSDNPTLEDFINKLNGFLKRYSDVIAMRHGDRKIPPLTISD
jgi:hypothetical protein